MPARPERELSLPDRQRLDDAGRRLHDAVAAYEPYLGRALKPGEPLPTSRLEEVASAQAAVEAAEDELWRLREELQGWVRPPSAPRATLVSDWFSEEDAAYDETPVS